MNEDVSRETKPAILDSDAVIAALPTLLGDGYSRLKKFHEMIQRHGVERGLIGPREEDRIWDRHIINSIGVVPFLKDCRYILDVGSGAGFPGIVVAIMLPESQVDLIEPMERRCLWLNEVIAEVGIPNATVKRGRAEEFVNSLSADGVTARAVAAMDKLARWTLPLVSPGGKLVAMKGQRAGAEMEAAAALIKKLGGYDPKIHRAPTVKGFGETTVVEVFKR